MKSNATPARARLNEDLKPYLAKPHRHVQGVSRLLIGQLIPLLGDGISLFVVRVKERHRIRRVAERQAMKRSSRGRVYDRTCYSTSRTYYVVSAIEWQTGKIAELQAFPTKAEAQRAMRSCSR